MLAELQRLASTLSRFGLQTPACHPWVKPQEKGDFLVVSLGADGCVAEVEFRPSIGAVGLAKIQKDNQNSFPTFKIPAPIWLVDANDPQREKVADAKLTILERTSLFRAMCQDAEFSQSPAQRTRLAARLSEFARDLLPRFRTQHEDRSAFVALLQVVATPGWAGEQLLSQIGYAALRAYEQGSVDGTGLIEALLIGVVRKDGDVDERKVTVILDFIRAQGDASLRVAHPGMTGIYHRALLATEQAGEEKGICSLTGREGELELDKLPNPKLPELNATFLMSMNRDSPCHLRYRRIGPAICPIGKNTAKEVNDAVLWITAPERERKTWRLVPRETKASPRNDLLIAYVESRPDLPAALADFFAGATDAGPEEDFEAIAQSVVGAIDADGSIAADAVIDTLVLRRIDKGRVQIELNRQYRVEQIRDGLREWRRAAADAPDFFVLVPKGKGQPAIRCKPWCPSPAQVLRATRSTWIRGGTQALRPTGNKRVRRGIHEQTVAGCSLATVHDLYLSQGNQGRGAAELLLARITGQSTSLLTFCGEQLRLHGPAVLDMPVETRRAAVLVATIIAMCLYKLNRHKEDYMQEPAFLLGRFLALADILHEQYCQVVRKGDVPPQLLGYQHFAMTADNAQSALSVLHSRFGVYYQWARTAKANGDNPETLKCFRIAQWAKSRLGETAEQLAGRLPDGPLNSAQRAEMLLGYLARVGTSSGNGDQVSGSDSEETSNA